jgi:hypothetical protein
LDIRLTAGKADEGSNVTMFDNANAKLCCKDLLACLGLYGKVHLGLANMQPIAEESIPDISPACPLPGACT